MGQGAAKEKPGEEKDAKTTDKDNKTSTKKSEDNKTSTKKSEAACDDLIKFMRAHYEEKVQPARSFDEFYHAIYELMEMFAESRGQLQYRIPPKKELLEQYRKLRRWDWDTKKNLSQEEFEKLAKEIFKVNRLTFGKAAVDVLVVLFGLPVCAVVTKRFIPGVNSISDDIVIPAATSGAVVYLAKTNKL